jgi:hypothetical protein
MDVTRQKKPSIARNGIGLMVLVTIVVIAILELKARSDVARAVQRLEDAQRDLETNRFAPALAKEQVQIILGRPPVGLNEREGAFDRQIYVWNGVFRSYILSAYFLGDEPKQLESFVVDNRLRGH